MDLLPPSDARLRRGLRLGLVLVALGSVAGVAAEERPRPRRGAAVGPVAIHLHRPARVGRRVRLVVEGSEDSTTTMQLDGRVVRDTHVVRDVRLEAEVTVREVDDRGRALRESYRVIDFVLANAGMPDAVVVRRGATIELRRAPRRDDAAITVNGIEVLPQVRAAFELVVTTTLGASEDELFGTPELRRAGESWDANGAALGEELRVAAGVEATLAGRTTFVGDARSAGVACRSIRSELRGELRALPGFPAGAVVRTGSLELSVRGAYPIDLVLPAVERSLTTRLVLDVDFVEDGRPGTVRTSSRSSRHARLRLRR